MLATVAGIAEARHRAAAVIERVRELLDGLGDAPGEVQAFADGVLAKLAGIDAPALQSDLDALATAIAATNAAAVAGRASAATATLAAQLAAIAPAEQLAAIAQSRSAPRSARSRRCPRRRRRTRRSRCSTRADPLAPALAAPLGALAAVRRRVTEAGAAMTRELADWDSRYHGPGDTLPAIAALQATPAALTAWVRDALQPQVVAPLRALLAPAGPLRAALGAVVAQLRALVTVLEDKLAAFGTGPGSAGAITAAIDALLARLRGLDLAFLRESLDELFAQVRGKIVAISPDTLADELDAIFEDALGALDVGQLLPREQIEALDERVLTLVGTLRALDPGAVVAAVQPIFEQDVLPLIDAFDIGAALERVVTMLHALLAELDGELGRVNTSYRAMLAAVPEPSPISIDIDIDIDIDVDVGGMF